MDIDNKVVAAAALGVCGGILVAGSAIAIKSAFMIKHLNTRLKARAALLRKMRTITDPTAGDVLYFILEADRINSIKI